MMQQGDNLFWQLGGFQGLRLLPQKYVLATHTLYLIGAVIILIAFLGLTLREHWRKGRKL